jgi:lysophospholipase L1-like esterase
LRRPILALAFACLAAPASAQEDGVIASMDEVRFQAPKDKGRIELAEGHSGKANRFRFDPAGSFFASNLRGNTDWDHAEGVSFWVKNEGEDGFCGLEFIFEEDYSVRYDVCFPVKGRDWTRVTVAWTDLIPVLPGPKGKPLGVPGGNPPSKLSALWVGRWWYWGKYPALDFRLDDLRLEPTVPRDTARYRPEGPPLARVLAKLEAGMPVTIVTMGDSLTDKRHWANREVAWVDLLREQIKAKYGSDATIVNPAIGGTQLRQNLVLMPTWLGRAPEPDLVTVFFGGNDYEAGMRGEEFRATCEDAVDRIRRATRGKADVLLITPIPSATRWDGLADLADACRAAARGRNAGGADARAGVLSAGRDSHDHPFVHDHVHLARPGHEAVAGAVLAAIASAGR